MPLTCINHLFRVLQSPHRGAVAQPLRGGRCRVVQLWWVRAELQPAVIELPGPGDGGVQGPAV